MIKVTSPLFKSFRADVGEALWMKKCSTQRPPIRPAPTTWSDVVIHRHLLHLASQSTPNQEVESGDDSMDDVTLDHDDPLSAQGGMGGGGGIAPINRNSPVRRDVWERSSSGLPTHLHVSARASTSLTSGTTPFTEQPILSHMPFPTTSPTPNYKHLFVVQDILGKRLRSSLTARNSHGTHHRTIDAYSSIEAGGLPGHSEAIYSLDLIRHRMQITLDQCAACVHPPPEGPFDAFMTFNDQRRPHSLVITGRDWLLSGSRDKTLRLWQLSCHQPKVVKVFHGGHTGSVLTHFVVKVKPTKKDGTSDKERIMAVSGGSDGKICLWDVEGDGKPEKEVQAHFDSILCVRGEGQRIASCSKGEYILLMLDQADKGIDRTIRIFDLMTLRQLMTIEGDDEGGLHRAAANAVGLSQDYVYVRLTSF